MITGVKNGVHCHLGFVSTSELHTDCIVTAVSHTYMIHNDIAIWCISWHACA